MSKHRKPDDLLDELSSLQSLLGDAARDVPANGDDDIPVLPAEEGAEGDAANQIPLLEPAPDNATPDNEDRQARLRKEAMSRANPFLSPAPSTTTPTEELEKQIAKKPSPTSAASQPPAETVRTPTERGTATSASPKPALDDATLRALVDEVLAQWLPRIERELRNRLMDEFRSRQDQDTPE